MSFREHCDTELSPEILALIAEGDERAIFAAAAKLEDSERTIRWAAQRALSKARGNQFAVRQNSVLHSTPPLPNMPSKRASSEIFSIIDQLNADDSAAAKRRKKVTLKSVSKSKAARSQNELFTSLMEARILLQRAIHASSKALHDRNDDSNETIEKACDDLLNNLTTARKQLCKHEMNGNDDINNKNKDNNEETVRQSSYESCREIWKNVLDKKHGDLQINSGQAIKSSKKFQTIDQSFWTQVTSTVAHDRIMKQANAATNMNENSIDETESKSSKDATTSQSDQYSVSSARTLFQDDKLYQHMLKDFIASSTTSNNNNIQNDAHQRLLKAMQKSKKNHKQIDRKASKGRKIRYTVHPKLTNFTFPIQRPIPFINEDDWFKSLFGGSHTKKARNGAKSGAIV